MWTEAAVLTGWLSLGSELLRGSLRVQNHLAGSLRMDGSRSLQPSHVTRKAGLVNVLLIPLSSRTVPAWRKVGTP